jgi:hypothetical protein
MSNLEQVTVPLPPALREFVQRAAEAEDRSMASVIRRLSDEQSALGGSRLQRHL